MTIERDTPPLNSLYQQLILEHYKHPRNKGALEDADARAHLNNPTCGDEIWLMVKLDGDRIAAAKFVGDGCSISQASVSMMTQLLIGRTRAEAEELARRFTALMHGEKVVSLELPKVVELTVTETTPQPKGATATNQMKDATLETGLRTRVPPFIDVGEVVRINTEDGSYLSRAKG